MKFLQWEIIPSGEREKYHLKYLAQREITKSLEEDLEIKKAQLYDHIARLSSSQETCKKLRSYCDKYKELYLNEVQKRLELAELVRKLESEQKDDEIIF